MKYDFVVGDKYGGNYQRLVVQPSSPAIEIFKVNELSINVGNLVRILWRQNLGDDECHNYDGNQALSVIRGSRDTNAKNSFICMPFGMFFIKPDGEMQNISKDFRLEFTKVADTDH